MVFVYQRKGEVIAESVGWPGFIGVLSGIKKGKFAMSLNAAISHEPYQVAMPVSFLLREVLLCASSFEEAAAILSKTPIASDCLLLLTGVQKEQMKVIERTPRNFSQRHTDECFLVVTNDYKILNNEIGKFNFLQASSCTRFDTATSLLRNTFDVKAANCWEVLKHPKIKMDITVQQMLFNAYTGEFEILLPKN